MLDTNLGTPSRKDKTEKIKGWGEISIKTNRQLVFCEHVPRFTKHSLKSQKLPQSKH